MKQALTLLSLLTCISIGLSQHYELSVQDHLKDATYVVEAKVISSKSYWNDNRTNIYTVYDLMVYRSFQNNLSSSTVQLIVPGGTVDLDMQIVSETLELHQGDIGVLTLIPFQDSIPELDSSIPKFQSYAGEQSMFHYDFKENKVRGLFIEIDNIQDAFMPMIQSNRETIQVINDLNVDALVSLNSNNSATVLSISNINPSVVNAGTKTVITITGSDFGAVQGDVAFANADAGGANFFTVRDSEIISWSDTEVQVEVASGAGNQANNVVIIPDASTGLPNSTGTVTINYNLTNAVSDALNPPTVETYRTQHYNQSTTSGGYIFTYDEDFASNTDAKTTIETAFNTWICSSGINFTLEDGTTNVGEALDDDINIVSFDDEAELPNGVLGRATSYFGGCFNGGSIDWVITELDIVFDGEQSWAFTGTPTASQFDFESVAAHEIGHAHQHGHVIDPAAMMHFSIGNGQVKRDLTANDIAGAADIMAISTSTAVCGTTVMTPISCPVIGNIIITEIMQNPNSVSDDNGEWFEIYNTTSADIDIDGWLISDDGGSSHTINNGGSLIVAANDFLVLGVNDDIATNGGVVVDYEFSIADIGLGNADDEIILSTTVSGNTVEVDRVNYDGGPNFPDPTGASMTLDPLSFNTDDNDIGANWCVGTIPYGDGDLGSPGQANDCSNNGIHTATTDACTTADGGITSVGLGIWQTITHNGELIAQINDMGNNLGVVSTDFYISTTAREDDDGTNYLNRSLFINPATDGAAMIRYFLADAELQALITDSDGDVDEVNSIGELVITRLPSAVCSTTFNGNNGAIIAPTAVPFGDDWYLEFEVPGFSGFAAHGGVLPLPIYLVFFDGELIDNNHVELSWQTAVEVNNDFFEIYRSTDNGATWQNIGTVSGAGNSNTDQNYSLIDESPAFGSNFYRLKQVDFDGTESFEGDIVQIDITSELNVVSFNRNQAQITCPKNGRATVDVYNMQGVLVDQVEFIAHEGLQAVQMAQLPYGVYILRVKQDNEVVVSKYVITP